MALRLTPAQKTALRWVIPCALMGCAAAWYSVSTGMYVQQQLDVLHAAGEISSEEIAKHDGAVLALLYIFPCALLGGGFAIPFMCLRGWFARKSGPGAGYFDAVFASAKQDLAKSMQHLRHQRASEQEARIIDEETVPAASRHAPARRL